MSFAVGRAAVDGSPGSPADASSPATTAAGAVRASRYDTATSPTRSAQMIAPRARWRVCDQPERSVRICSPPTIAWIGNRIAAIVASARIGRVRGRSRTAATKTAATISPTITATQRWRTWAEFASVSVGKTRPVHQRPVREHVPLGRRGHVRAEQQQRVHRARAERGQQREPLAATAREPRRIERAGEDPDEQADEGHRRREVSRHRLSGVAEADRLAAQPGLEPDEQHRDDRRGEERPLLPQVQERQDHERR